jgi:hypothetical protein
MYQQLEVEICTFVRIYQKILDIYHHDESLSILVAEILRFPYLEKVLGLLKPWSTWIDSDTTGRIDKNMINKVLMLTSATEKENGGVYLHKNQFEKAEDYCQQALSNPRLYKEREERQVYYVEL